MSVKPVILCEAKGMTMSEIKKNDEFEIEITDMSNDGEGIGHANGMTFFVKDAVVGDVIIAGATKLKKTYGYARIVRLVQPSVYRSVPACPISRRCGGCQLQQMNYASQLEFKQKKVMDALTRIGGIGKDRFSFDGTDDGIEFYPIIGMDDPFHYRNKGQFPVGTDKNGNVICGFYATHSHDIVDTKSCLLQHDITDELMTAVRGYMTECGIGAFYGNNGEIRESVENLNAMPKTKTAGRGKSRNRSEGDENGKYAGSGKNIVRHVLTRVGFTTHEVMVCVVIAADTLPCEERLVRLLNDAVEKYNTKNNADYCLNSVSYCVNTENTNVIMGEKVVNIAGLPYITDYIGDTRYRISPLSFYQVNPVQTEKLYSTALEFAAPDKNDTVWDLYCGIGTISLYFAKHVKKVFGIEIVPQAIEDATENARLNGITNAEFFCGAAEELFPKLMSSKGQGAAQDSEAATPDIVIVDPPRKGCDAALIDCIGTLSPRKLVYVSCDPATLARDIKLLAGYGYEPVKIRPCDMFPQTGHVETVVSLIKNT